MLDWTQLWEQMVSAAPALVGAVIGGLFTLRAAKKAAQREADKERRADEKIVQNLLDALGVEIQALWGFHMKRIGTNVEKLPAGQPLLQYYPLTQDYFTIYNSNASAIGSVKDDELRKAIVITYNKCKKVVDGFKYNNDLLKAGDIASMTALAVLIKEDHFELKGYIEEFLRLLASRNS